MVSVVDICRVGSSADKLRHPRSDAYPAEQVLLNKQQIWGGGACLHGHLGDTQRRKAQVHKRCTATKTTVRTSLGVVNLPRRRK